MTKEEIYQKCVEYFNDKLEQQIPEDLMFCYLVKTGHLDIRISLENGEVKAEILDDFVRDSEDRSVKEENDSWMVKLVEQLKHGEKVKRFYD